MNHHPIRRRLAAWLGVLLASLFLVPGLAAQDAAGMISGRVVDSGADRAMHGAIIRVSGTSLRAETDRDGTFVLRNVPAGEHVVEASYFGAEPRTLTVTVASGSVATANFNFGESEVELAEMMIVGEVMGQARAVNQQRVATAMVNITSDELFGEMTDNNIAKALQRIPGISANSDGGTEVPRYVNIRGFDGSLNSVQMNGSRLPTSGTGQGTVYGDTARAFALDDLPANAVSTIEIIKAPTPDMDGDTVGGIVNLVTKSAFERSGRSLEFNLGADYSALRDNWVPHIDLGYSDLFMEGRLGVRLDLSYYKGDEGFDNIDYDSLPLVPQLPFNEYLGLPTDGRPVFAHEDTEYNNYFIERDRYGFAASFDYKLSENTELYFRPTYTYELRDEDDRRYHKIMDNDHGRTASAPPAGAAVGTVYTGTRGTAVVTEPGRGAYRTYNSVSYDAAESTLLPNGRGRGSAGYRQSLNERHLEFYSLDLGARHTVPWGEVKWSLVNSTSAKNEMLDSVRFDRLGMQWAYDRSDIFRPQYDVVNGIDPLAVPTRGEVDYFTNPSSSNFTRADRATEESVTQAKVDVKMPFLEGTGIDGQFKTGAKLRWMDRESDRDQYFWRLTNFATFDFADYLRQSDNTVSDFDMPYTPDTRRMISEAMSDSPNFIRDTSNARRLNSLNNDYTASEDSIEGYAMAEIQAGPKLRLTGGVRVEHTQFEATTPVYDPADLPLANRADETITHSNDYTVVLPGFHLRYEARNNVVARAAYTHTYGRPAFREMVAVTSFDEVNNTIATGNPYLKPYNSENWDVSFEYFGKDAAYLQVAFFYKKVENFVLETGETIFGSDGFPGLELDPNETYTVSTFSNAHDGVNRGVEVAGRYRFTSLPRPLDGLYFDGSVTYTDSNGKYADRPGEDLPTYGASEWLYFVGLGYQRDRFSIFLSYRFRDQYLEGLESVDQQNRELGFPPDAADDWWGPERYWNLETSYRVSERLKVYFNVSNLFEYRNYSTQSPPANRYPEDSYWHKRRFAVGLKGSF